MENVTTGPLAKQAHLQDQQWTVEL